MAASDDDDPDETSAPFAGEVPVADGVLLHGLGLTVVRPVVAALSVQLGPVEYPCDAWRTLGSSRTVAPVPEMLRRVETARDEVLARLRRRLHAVGADAAVGLVVEESLTNRDPICTQTGAVQQGSWGRAGWQPAAAWTFLTGALLELRLTAVAVRGSGRHGFVTHLQPADVALLTREGYRLGPLRWAFGASTFHGSTGMQASLDRQHGGMNCPEGEMPQPTQAVSQARQASLAAATTGDDLVLVDRTWVHLVETEPFETHRHVVVLGSTLASTLVPGPVEQPDPGVLTVLPVRA